MSQYKNIQSITEVKNYTPSKERLFSADNSEITSGWTTDIYFIKSREILRNENLAQAEVAAEIFPGRAGVMAGTQEVKNLLGDLPVDVRALEEGEHFDSKEVVMQISGSYDYFSIYETAFLGILASSSGWATAANQCKNSAGDKSVVCFGARHVHPAVAPVMERSAIIGGADGASCILGAKLAGREPMGTIPHAVMLVVGDTLKAAEVYSEIMPPESPVIMLVDTFKDEAEESLRLGESLKERLEGVRLDTASERGGVTPGLVKEIRGRLDLAGLSHVQIFVSGGVNPERMPGLIKAGADSFGVGSYISAASPIDMTMDLKEVNGRPVAKRGRIPGQTRAPRLTRII
ncbi:MAG: nicotinate phosphoribosyltransferase [Clostridiales bacterium]|nr:nicotinate phosphoribosyltransferase [Clostridiales bacterium]MCF8022566.1 nicotinate phosphoribosyltransferase [Clostridiales bacterium]